MGEQKGSLWLVVIGLVLFGVIISVAKPMMETMMDSINTKMQDTINSVDTGIGTYRLSADTEAYLAELVG